MLTQTERGRSSKTISSLPSSPPAAAAEDSSPNLPSPPRGQPGSPAFSTTSTADEGGSSPVLPPLPVPTFNGRVIDLSRVATPPSEVRSSNSSHYYTASWGSPYQQPAAPSSRGRSHGHSQTLSSEASSDSPVRHLEFYTPYLRPAPTFARSQTEPDFVSQDGLISAAVLANRARRPATGLTEDWIRQHTGGEAAEGSHWLSDGDPGESERSSLSGSVSGESGDWLGEDTDPRTPTLKRFLQTRDNQRPTLRGHRKNLSSATLRREDFLDSSVPIMSLNEDNISGVEMQIQAPSPLAERPPPPPPKEGPWRAASLPAFNAPPPPAKTPSPGPPRLKKKVVWKGKNILVLLPWDDERGQHGKAPKPMTEHDVDVMMKEWQQLGYDTTGFNLGPENFEGYEAGKGQSCSPWPYLKDILAEKGQGNFRISIPDRREWDAYVQELNEAKLRALGVSEDPILTISPAMSNPQLSRRTSMQYPALPFSPPPPTSSATSSHHGRNQSMFSPNLMQGGISTSQSSNPGSTASPISMHSTHLQGKYSARLSISYSSSEHPFGSPFQYPQQNSPGVWSPQQMMFQQGHARGGSPSLGNLGAIINPTSPFSQDGYFPPSGDAMAQMQHRQQFLQNQLSHQQQMQLHGGARASPRLQELRETEEEAVSVPPKSPPKSPLKSPSKTPDATQSRPNPASLQKEIDAAEYHLEEQFQRQMEGDDYSPHSDEAKDQFNPNPDVNHTRNTSSFHGNGMAASRYANASDDGPVLHHPQPHSRGHSLSQRPFGDNEESAADAKLLAGAHNAFKPDLSDVETTPSNTGTPAPQGLSSGGHDRTLSVVSNPWAELDSSHADEDAAPRRGHSSKPSMSTLNVAAKEFKFNPSSSFQANNFAFGGNHFQPPVAAFSTFVPPVSATSSHFSHGSIASSKGKINVAAPVFSPSNSEFNFSASGPTFRPDAPAFTPLASNFSGSIGSGGSGSEGLRTSLFGNIDLNALGINKPPKKSKAIPIVRPDSSHSKTEDDTMEGKDGRITQGEARFKRARGDKGDGDSVPLFAEPKMPLSETTREQSPPKEAAPVLDKSDKENSAPPDLSEEDVPEVPKSYSRSASPASPPEQDIKDFAPWEFSQQKQAEDFNAARPYTSRRYGSGLPAYGNFVASGDEKHDEVSPEMSVVKPKGHKKSNSSLSATAKPFEFKPSAFNFTFGQSSELKSAVASPPPSQPKPNMGLSASRYARSPTPPPKAVSPEIELDAHETSQFQEALPPLSPSAHGEEELDEELPHEVPPREQTFEEIDDVMRHLNEAEAAAAPGPDEAPRWLQPSPQRQITMPSLENSSPIRLQPQNIRRSDAPSPSPRRFHPLPGETNVFGRISEDPFRGDSVEPDFGTSPVHHLHGNMNSLPPSEWDDVLSETEEAKLAPRAQFFDNHVNELIDGLLSDRLEPLEKTLETIQMSIEMMATRESSRRRERRSISGVLSDADDEDDENPRRSLSPQRRDKRLDKIRAIFLEALSTHAQSSRPQTATSVPSVLPDSRNVLQALEEMKEQFGTSMRLDLRGEDLRNIVEEAVERRMPEAAVDEAALAREAEQKARIAELEEKLLRAGEESATRLASLEEKLTKTVEEAIQKNAPSSPEEAKPVVDEAALAREAEQRAKIADLEERLMRADGDNTSRIADLEERLHRAEMSTEEEINNRRAAEDRLAEVQRLLRASSGEEDRLRDAMEEREIKIREIVDDSDQKVRNVEEHRAKVAMKIALLEANAQSALQAEAELQKRINITEHDLRDSRQDVQRWQMEAERAIEAAKRHNDDAEVANETNKDLRRTIESLRTQMEESIRVREGMRGKLINLQEDMAQAARNISEENARRAKKEQELIARQEVLDAKLQAEARTRERLEREIERLEQGEREGMRAVSDCKKLETLLSDVKMQSHNAQKEAMRYKREFEEARESGLSELQRTRHYMQAEIEAANNQVNVVREDLENQILRLRAENDNVKLDADTTRAKNEMLLEEAETSKDRLLEELKHKHANTVEDLQAAHDRQLNNAIEDAQRSEQHLLERLSLSTAKTEHLQDRVAHLEEKLEIANQAANAAATAAKTARSTSGSSHAVAASEKRASRGMELPQRISSQALRESIMVLQEQLQERESQIEELKASLSTVDIDAPTKITKRDDEISWLRELLSVRKSDLQDIVQALETERYDPDRVRDAAIRLRANLQMEEQERERAMNGGSSINLPNIAASMSAMAASPRVASAVGPLAAAWGNWRKGRAESVAGAGNEGSGRSTPSRARNESPTGSFLSGLLTPPASHARAGTPPAASSLSLLRSGGEVEEAGSGTRRQPSAFGNTGMRMSGKQLVDRDVRRAKANPLVMSGGRDSGLGSRESSGVVSNRGGPGPDKFGSAGFGGRSDVGDRRERERERDWERERERERERLSVPSTPPMMRKSNYDADAEARVEDSFSDAGFYDDDSSTVEGGDIRGFAHGAHGQRVR